MTAASRSRKPRIDHDRRISVMDGALRTGSEPATAVSSPPPAAAAGEVARPVFRLPPARRTGPPHRGGDGAAVRGLSSPRTDQERDPSCPSETRR
jgi:hypothetical protein